MARVLANNTGKFGGNNVVNVTPSFLTAPKVGNWLFVGLAIYSSGAGPLSDIVDNFGGNGWGKTEQLATFSGVSLWGCKVVNTGSPFTLTVTCGSGAATNFFQGYGFEVDGASLRQGGAPLDASITNAAVSATSGTTGVTAARRSPNGLQIGVVCFDGDDSNLNASITSPDWTTVAYEPDGHTNVGFLMGTKQVRGRGTQEMAFSMDTASYQALLMSYIDRGLPPMYADGWATS